jgi:hypothetical protein
VKPGGALKRGKGLSRMSVKQKARFIAAGVSFPSSTFRPREPKTPRMRAVKAGGRPAATGFDKATSDAILEREGHCCGRCGGALWGERGLDYSIQHRRARGMGGTDRPDTNAPQNGIALCGSATTGCHGYVEAHPEEAEADGYRVPQGGDPLMFPVVHFLHGPGTFLRSNGSWGSRPEGVCA